MVVVPDSGLGLLKADFKVLYDWIRPGIGPDPYGVRYAATISVWVRWLMAIGSAIVMWYRPIFTYSTYVPYLLLLVLLVLLNGSVHYRLVSNRVVTWGWVVALSAMDIALITASIIVSGLFKTFFFLPYYPALAMFAVVLDSVRPIIIWTTMVAILYTVVSLTVGSGLDFDASDEKVLFARLVVMYAVVLCVSLITRFERIRRKEAVERERALLQERIELSQTIHDTTAQTAYMIGLGLETAMDLAGDSNAELTATLAATSALSKVAMLELRRPINAGQIFEGRNLGSVLESHTATFTTITSVPVEMTQSGTEPPLTAEIRTRLFSIAHNALTNAFRHARASGVEVRLDFEADWVRLSVTDDGVGLPDDYAERGRGFNSMKADAERLGGRLTVEMGGRGRGTMVTCLVPFERGARND